MNLLCIWISIFLRTSWWILRLNSLSLLLILLLRSGSISLHIIVSTSWCSNFSSTYNLISGHINPIGVWLRSRNILWSWHLVCFLTFWLDWISIMSSIMKVHLTTWLRNHYSSIFTSFTRLDTSWCMSCWNIVICLCLRIINALFSIHLHLSWITYKLWKRDLFFIRIIAISIRTIIHVNWHCRNSIYSVHPLHMLTKWCWFFCCHTSFLNISFLLSTLN